MRLQGSSNYNSSAFKTIKEPVDHYKDNKVDAFNISFLSKYKDVTISYETILDDYREVLIERSVKRKIPNNFLYKPEYVSKLVYGTPDLWYLVLLVNDCPSFMEFDRPEILILPPSELNIVNSLIEKHYKRVQFNHEDPVEINDMIIKKF